METEKRTPTYANLITFIIPLALMPIMMNIGRQFINGGMARMPDAKITLAAYGLAFGLVNLFTSFLMPARNLGLVLIDSRQSLLQVFRFIAVCSLVPIGILVVLVATPFGGWFIIDLHDTTPQLAEVVLFALLCFLPLPFFNSLTTLLTGYLINVHKTALVSFAGLMVILVRIAMVLLLVSIEGIRARPILLPVFVAYGGLAAHLIIYSIAMMKVLPTLPDKGEGRLAFKYVFHFFWPLAIVNVVVGGSRPLINLLISQGENGVEALAILAVVFPLASLPYGWVNQNRSLVAAYRDYPGSRKLIKRFALGTGMFSFATMVILFWTPLRTVILEQWIQLDPELAAQCAWPLRIFVFFPFAVMVRAYFQGIALVEHRTKAMAPSGPSRLIAILAVYGILLLTPIPNAVAGVIALLSGFAAEAGVVRYCIKRARRKEREMREGRKTEDGGRR